MFDALREYQYTVVEPEESVPIRCLRVESAAVSTNKDVIGLQLLKSTCGCANKNCFAVYRSTMLDPVASILEVREERLKQGFTCNGKGEGPWLARKLLKSRKYIGGTKPYKVCFEFTNVRVCRHTWEVLHGLPPGSSRISNYIATINKGKDPTLRHADERSGEKRTQRKSVLENWCKNHILMMSECSPVGSEPRMFVPKMTFKDRHRLYKKETHRERTPVCGPSEPPLSKSHSNKVWKKVMSEPYLHPETQQYYELQYRTNKSRGFNQCDTCEQLKAEIAKGDPSTYEQSVADLEEVSVCLAPDTYAPDTYAPDKHLYACAA